MLTADDAEGGTLASYVFSCLDRLISASNFDLWLRYRFIHDADGRCRLHANSSGASSTLWVRMVV
jgi:hypothetical protein